MAFEDKINPAKRLPVVFVWPCWMESHRQATMFVFPEQCGPADLSKAKRNRRRQRKEREKERTKEMKRKRQQEKRERKRLSASRNTMGSVCHLFPIEKVV